MFCNEICLLQRNPFAHFIMKFLHNLVQFCHQNCVFFAIRVAFFTIVAKFAMPFDVRWQWRFRQQKGWARMHCQGSFHKGHTKALCTSCNVLR